MNVISHRQKIQASESNTPLILVVEDEEDNLLYISHTLLLLKYNFITARKGQTALDLATQYQIDLVLLDLVLPDMNGFDLVKCLKENKLTQNMPIIVTSALARKQEQEKALASGCDAYLTKPYLIDDLERTIRQFLPQPFFNYQALFLNPFSFKIGNNRIDHCLKFWNIRLPHAKEYPHV